MTKVILQGYIDVAESSLPAVLLELPKHIELSRAETGCVVFTVEQDKVLAYRFHVYEEFTNQQAFDTHQQRVSASRWGGITKNASRHYEVERQLA